MTHPNRSVRSYTLEWTRSREVDELVVYNASALFEEYKGLSSKRKVSHHTRSRMNPILFNRIESHYKGLDLCERFAERSDNVISEIHRDYIASKDAKVTPLQFWEMQRSRAMQEQSVFGFNYWRSILILECCNNPSFRSYFENQNTTPWSNDKA